MPGSHSTNRFNPKLAGDAPTDKTAAGMQPDAALQVKPVVGVGGREEPLLFYVLSDGWR